VSRSRGQQRSKTLLSRRTLLIGASGAAAATAFGGYWNSESLKVNRQTIHLPKWDADGFRVALVTDIHANSKQQAERAQEAMRLAVAEKPDLIVFGGDFLDFASPQICQHVETALNELHDARCPIYGVYGNHDWFCLDTKRLHDTVKKTPMKLLFNRSVEVNGVTLAGIGDAVAKQHKPQILNRDRSSASLLVVFHEPDYVTLLPDFVSLHLAGHSHGGEICLPGGIPIRHYLPKGAKKYVSGFYPDAKVPLFVSRGVATCAPFRLFCPPEINVLTLYGKGGTTRV
jgi:hypothetical protein